MLPGADGQVQQKLACRPIQARNLQKKTLFYISFCAFVEVFYKSAVTY